MPTGEDLAKAGVFLSEDGTLHISTERECRTCHVTKLISEFRITSSHGKRVRAMHCKQCHREKERARIRAREADKGPQVIAEVAITTPEPEPMAETPASKKARYGKAPRLDLSLLSQAKDFAYAWELMLGREGFQEQWVAVPDIQKQAVVDELKKLQKMTKQLLKRTEGKES